MNKTISAIILILLLPIFLFSIDKNNYFKNIVIIKVKPEFRQSFTKNDEFINFLSKNSSYKLRQKFPNSSIPQTKYNIRGEKLVDLSLIYQIEFKQNSNIWGIISYLSKFDFVDYAEPLYHNKLLYVPDDPFNQTDQYWLDLIQAYDAWNIHKGDTNIFIGIVDTGIDIAHEDLVWNIKYNYNDMITGYDDDGDGYVDNFRGWDFGDNNNNPQADVHFHGSWVSGIASASTDNGLGISGVGFKCRFLPIKVMDSTGVIRTAYEGLVYAADQGSHVINCSWGNTVYQQMAQDVINYATYNRDALVIGACGNSNSELVFYPASYENVISVAATTIDDEKWTPQNTSTTSGSSYSPLVDVSAPGTMMLTTDDEGYYRIYGGTSFAAPVVAGAAAFLKSYFLDYSALQIGELLKIGADNIDTIPANTEFAGMLGTGRINMYKSLTMNQTPSVVLKNIEISKNRKIGDTVIINGDFINYLAPANNIQVSISSKSSNINIINNFLHIGELNTLESFTTNNFIKISALPETPYDYFTFIQLEYFDEGYYSVQNIPIILNYNFKNISTEKLNLSIVPNGRFGYSNLDANIGDGFVYNDLICLFNDSGIICGNSPQTISSSVRKIKGFNTIKDPIYIQDNDKADNIVKTVFNNDYSSDSLYVEIIQTAYSWDHSNYKNFIIVEFEIVNKSNKNIDSYYFGIFNDWDLIDPSNNSAYFNFDKQIMYCQNNDDSQTMYAGVKLLSEQNPNNYALAQISGGDGDVDITNGLNDEEKFHVISNSNSGVGNQNDGFDLVIFNSAGPFDIKLNDTVKLVFAFIASDNLDTFLEATEKSKELYKNYFSPNIISQKHNYSFNIFPNPADRELTILFDSEYIGKSVNISIYDKNGKLVYVDFNKNIISLEKNMNIDFLKMGVYNLVISYDKTSVNTKLLIID